MQISYVQTIHKTKKITNRKTVQPLQLLLYFFNLKKKQNKKNKELIAITISIAQAKTIKRADLLRALF